jgi:stearoyl-CoA desaturase (delta-9 desaturase)
MTQAVPVPGKAPLNVPAIVLFSLTTAAMLTIFPWYALTHEFSGASWIAGLVLLYLTGLSITGGYHRLWAHRTYQAHPALKIFYLLFGAMSLQNSVLIWASSHRIHHRHVDDIQNDPYSIRRGFWFAHMGWMLRDYPSSELDFKNADDLKRDPFVMFQHRHYLLLALGMNFGVPLALGLVFRDVWGFLLIAGLLRLVVSHQVTFLINSLAHLWGRRPYTADNSARDNDLIAFLTYGEGYHNYHHLFQWDYRNGIRWWHLDLTKWWIAGLAMVGMTRDLKRVPEFKIRRAMVQRQFERAQEKLRASRHPASRLEVLQRLLEQELEAFKATVNDWSHLQGEKLDAARKQLAEQWESSDMRRKLVLLEERLKLQHQRLRLLHLQTA